MRLHDAHLDLCAGGPPPGAGLFSGELGKDPLDMSRDGGLAVGASTGLVNGDGTLLAGVTEMGGRMRLPPLVATVVAAKSCRSSAGENSMTSDAEGHSLSPRGPEWSPPAAMASWARLQWQAVCAGAQASGMQALKRTGPSHIHSV